MYIHARLFSVEFSSWKEFYSSLKLLLPKRSLDRRYTVHWHLFFFFLVLILFSFSILYFIHLCLQEIDYLSEHSRGNEVTRSRRDFLRAVPSTSRHRPQIYFVILFAIFGEDISSTNMDLSIEIYKSMSVYSSYLWKDSLSRNRYKKSIISIWLKIDKTIKKRCDNVYVSSLFFSLFFC